MNPNCPAAETFLCNVLGDIHGFLSYSNFARENGLAHHNASTKHSVNAAEDLVKGLLCARGIDYDHLRDISSLCIHFQFLFPEDPIAERLMELEGFTNYVHFDACSDLLIPIESIEETTVRMKQVLIVLRALIREIFDGRMPTRDVRNLISITTSNAQSYADSLSDPELQEIAQESLDKIHEYLE